MVNGLSKVSLMISAAIVLHCLLASFNSIKNTYMYVLSMK